VAVSLGERRLCPNPLVLMEGDLVQAFTGRG